MLYIQIPLGHLKRIASSLVIFGWPLLGGIYVFIKVEAAWKQLSCRCMLLLNLFRSSSSNFLSAPLESWGSASRACLKLDLLSGVRWTATVSIRAQISSLACNAPFLLKDDTHCMSLLSSSDTASTTLDRTRGTNSLEIVNTSACTAIIFTNASFK